MGSGDPLKNKITFESYKHQLIPSMEEAQLLIELKEPGPDGRRISSFKAFALQKSLDDSIGNLPGQGLRHVILKARQMGFSTYIVLRLLAKCLMVHGTRAAIISHERMATMKLLRKVHLALTDLINRKVKINGKKIKVKYSTKYEIVFDDMVSSLYIGTAGQRAFSRGDSLTDVHCSEVAHWQNAHEMMLGVEGALTPSAELFLESTANGMGGYFYEMVEKCRNGNGPAVFHFFPWYKDPEYSLPCPDNADFSREELDLGNKYELTRNQLWWRRKKLDKYSRLEDFCQEFPSSIDEAFIVSGTCYFDKGSIKEASIRTRTPLFTGTIESLGVKATLRALSKEAPLEIYAHPEYTGSYLITADCAEGVDGGDFNSACVLDRNKFSEAAWVTGFSDPEEMGKILYALGQHYNWAWIAVEDNGPGLAVLMKLKQLGYPRLYMRVDPEDDTRTPRLGWRTDMRTRPLALGALRNALKTRVWIPASERFLRQCNTFCRQANGRYEANAGCHDDDVMSAAIAAYLSRSIPVDPLPADTQRNNRIVLQRNSQIRHGLKTGY